MKGFEEIEDRGLIDRWNEVHKCESEVSFF